MMQTSVTGVELIFDRGLKRCCFQFATWKWNAPIASGGATAGE
jgi:hypothetical protein